MLAFRVLFAFAVMCVLSFQAHAQCGPGGCSVPSSRVGRGYYSAPSYQFVPAPQFYAQPQVSYPQYQPAYSAPVYPTVTYTAPAQTSAPVATGNSCQCVSCQCAVPKVMVVRQRWSY